MPPFINKSWPILLMPLWWILWFLGLIFHNCYIFSKNEYRRIKANRRDPSPSKKEKNKKEKKSKKGEESESTS